MANSDCQIDKPQRGRPKRAELPYVNINTGAQSINTERDYNVQLTSYETPSHNYARFYGSFIISFMK